MRYNKIVAFVSAFFIVSCSSFITDISQFCNSSRSGSLLHDYSIKDCKIYYEGNEIIGVDASSFKQFDENLFVDRNHVIFEGQIYEESNAKNLFNLTDYYYSDGKNDYHKHHGIRTNKIEVLDPDTPIERLLEDTWIIADNKIVADNRGQTLDIQLTKELRYFRDGYYIDQDNLYDRSNTYKKGTQSYEVKFFWLKNGIKRADLNYNHSGNYGKSENFFYYKNVVLGDADLDLKIYRKNSDYSTDGSHVYYKGKQLKAVDLETFSFEHSSQYPSDEDYVYYEGQKTEIDVHSKQFYWINLEPDSALYANDKNGVYYKGKKIQGLYSKEMAKFDNPTNLWLFGDDVIYKGRIRKDLDSRKRKKLSPYYNTNGRDIYHVTEGKMEGVDLLSFKPVHSYLDYYEDNGEYNWTWFSGEEFIYFNDTEVAPMWFTDGKTVLNFQGNKIDIDKPKEIYAVSADIFMYRGSFYNQYGEAIQQYDQDTIRHIGYGFFQDKDNIYKRGNKLAINTAESHSFIALSDDTLGDVNGIYRLYRGDLSRTSSVNSSEFKFIGKYYALVSGQLYESSAWAPGYAKNAYFEKSEGQYSIDPCLLDSPSNKQLLKCFRVSISYPESYKEMYRTYSPYGEYPDTTYNIWKVEHVSK